MRNIDADGSGSFSFAELATALQSRAVEYDLSRPAVRRWPAPRVSSLSASIPDVPEAGLPRILSTVSFAASEEQGLREDAPAAAPGAGADGVQDRTQEGAMVEEGHDAELPGLS